MDNKVIKLWDGYDYQGEMEDGFQPIMTTFIREGDFERGLVMVLPGGGYQYTSPREAEPIAMQFGAAGYHAVVVDYSTSPRRHPQPLQDVARALTIVKDNAVNWKVDMEQIYIIGFSAGGHLCASICNLYQDSILEDVEGVNLEGLKIKGSILSYPVIKFGDHMHEGSFKALLGEGKSIEDYESMSMERHVHKNTPSTFIWHTYEDGSVPVENALVYVDALRKNGVPFEFHVYPKGGHGLSLSTHEVSCKEDESDVIPHVATWFKLCLEWMKQ